MLTGIFPSKYHARNAVIFCVGSDGGGTITNGISVVIDFSTAVIVGFMHFFIEILLIFNKNASLSTLQLVASPDKIQS